MTLDAIDNLPFMTTVFWSCVDRSGPCWLWMGCLDKDGYGLYLLSVHGVPWRVKAHRFAYLLAHGSLPPAPLVVRHHVCGNPQCCRPEHLMAGSMQDNHDDRERMGRTMRGDRHWAHLHPELRPWGQRNGAHTHPERRAAGDRNGSRTHPERVPRGDRHGSRTRPERRPRGEKHPMAKLSAEQVRQIRDLAAQGCPTRDLAAQFGIDRSQIRAIVRRTSWKDLV